MAIGGYSEGQVKLVAEWLGDLRHSYEGEPFVSDVRVGVFYTAVEISTCHVGVAFTPRGLSDTVCCPKTAAGAPPAGSLIGAKAWELAEYALSPSALRRALGIATLNALSAAAAERHGLSGGRLQENLDALDAALIADDDRVVMVGAFIPFIKRLKGRVASLNVIDKHRDALKPEERVLWTPPRRVSEVLANASVVIFSGSALVEGGVEELLEASAPARIRIMAGPTTPLWPRPFFKRGIAVLGGIQILDGRNLLTIVGQGGSGYLFGRAARKACLLDPSFDSAAQFQAVAEHVEADLSRRQSV
jgi:uncharacterized protein (DUF4213/DUF364 family)